MVMAVEDYDIETITTFTKDQAKVTASRYLSAPQGSCHDLCKFGIQNATTEAKPWKRAKKRVTVSTGGIKNKVQEENITSLAWTKKSGINSKPYTTSKFGSSNTLADIKEVINEETVNSKKNSPPSAETNVSTKEHNNNDLRKSVSHSKPSPKSKFGSSNSLVDTKEVIYEATVNSEKNSTTEETNVSTKGHKKKKQNNSDQRFSTKEQTNTDLRISTKEHNRRNLRQAQQESSKILAFIGDKEYPSHTKGETIKDKVVSCSSSRKHSEINSKQKTKPSLIEGKEVTRRCTTKKASSLNAKTTKNLKSVSSRKGNGKVEAKPELASNDILHEIVHTLDDEHTLPSDHNSMLPSAATKGLNHAGHGTCPSESMSILSAGGEGKRSHTRTLSSSSLSLISFGNKGKISHSRTPSGSFLPLINFGSKGKKSHSRTPSGSSLPLISSGGKGKKSHSRSISLSDFSLNTSNGKPGKKSHSRSTSLSDFSFNGKPLISSGGKGKKSHSRSTSLSDFSLNTSNGKQHDDATLKKTGNSENVKMGYQVKPRVSTVVGETNKVAPRKLTFRRGKVIEIQPENNNIPRRLKFRPVRTLNYDNPRDINAPTNVITEIYSPKFQIAEAIKMRSIARETGTEVDGSKPESEEEVLLRPPSVEKKANRRLYNNVIEETATMLAEVRKSKVKALVGAFETVISIDSRRQSRSALPEVSTPC
ncbi:ras guanine nucleotide exchange factor R isoform X2 [Arachis ipaensis]|uniref:ras guanine nucleotide exchange factor R isoform X2 n=1 Tax=Arachis ipaensis TaxID=130454 RepID=UPI000A2B7E90|nr:ras guanine nucleotide exchange factor R isoform X2 [Arachis ipaensis]XP_025629403.1 ras guanine nucleotide exchange factor R isoform X2 [Arachis hypogaea]